MKKQKLDSPQEPLLLISDFLTSVEQGDKFLLFEIICCKVTSSRHHRDRGMASLFPPGQEAQSHSSHQPSVRMEAFHQPALKNPKDRYCRYVPALTARGSDIAQGWQLDPLSRDA